MPVWLISLSILDSKNVNPAESATYLPRCILSTVPSLSASVTPILLYDANSVTAFVLGIVNSLNFELKIESAVIYVIEKVLSLV